MQGTHELQVLDSNGKPWILSRIDAAMLGNFGDCEPVGEGVSEMNKTDAQQKLLERTQSKRKARKR